MVQVADLLAVLRLQDELTPSLQETISTLQQVDKQAQLTAYQITLLGRGLMEAGSLATAAFTVPITEAAGAVIKFGSDFQTQMTRVVTLAGASTDEINSLRQGVLDLGASTGVGPEKLAQGLFVLESFGLRGAAAMDALTVAAKMSALGMGETSEIARGLTGVLFSYKDSITSAAEAGDILTKTTQLGNMRIDELIPAMAKLNPVAAAMGIKFEDVAAAVATFTHAGVNSAVATTGLRAALGNVLIDSAKTEKGFAALRSATGDTTLTMANFKKEIADKGLTAAMIDLANSTKSAGEEGTKALAMIFPNIRALTEILAVYHINGDMVVNTLNQLKDHQEVVDSGTKELAKTWQQQYNIMTVAVQELWIKLSTSLLPIFEKLISGFQSLIPVLNRVVEVFNGLPFPVQLAVVGLLALFAAMGPILISAGVLIMAIGNISRALPVVTEMFGLSTGSIVANTVAMAENTAATEANALTKSTQFKNISAQFTSLFKDAEIAGASTVTAMEAGTEVTAGLGATILGIASSPIVLAGAIASVGVAVLVVAANHGSLKAAAASTWDTIKTGAVASVTFLGNIATIIKDENIIRWNQVKAAAGDAWGVIKDMTSWMASTMPGVGKLIKNNFNDYLNTLRSDLSIIKQDFKDIADYVAGLRAAKDLQVHGGPAAPAGPGLPLPSTTPLDLKTINVGPAGLGGQITQTQTLLDKVRDLEQAKRDLIVADKASGLSNDEIAKKEGIANDVVGVYIRQVTLAAAASKAAAKEAAKMAEQEAAIGRINSLLGEDVDTVGMTAEQWSKLGIEAKGSLLDIHNATGISMGDLRLWKQQIIENDAENKQYSDDMLTSQNQINSLTMEAVSLETKAAGDSYEAKKDFTAKGLINGIDNLNKLHISDLQYYTQLEALTRLYNDKIAVIDADRVVKHIAALTQISAYEEHLGDTITQINDKTNHEIAKLHKSTLDTEIDAAQDAYDTTVKNLRISLDRELAEIQKNDALTEAEKKLHKDKIKAIEKDAEAAAKRLQDATEKAAQDVQLGRDMEALGTAIAGMGKQMTGTASVITSGVGGIIDSYGKWKDSTLSTTQKVSLALTTAMNIWTAGAKAATGSAAALNGAMQGAAAGAAIGGPWGAAIGAAGGALLGFIAHLNAGRQAVEDFAKSFATLTDSGGFDTLHQKLLALGKDGKQMWIQFTQNIGRGDKAAATAEIQVIQQALAKLDADVQKYNLTWADLTNAQVGGTKTGQDLFATFQELSKAGYSASSITKGMAADLNTYIGASIAAGTKIPAEMEPIIKQLIEMGLLTDDNKKALLGLSTIKLNGGTFDDVMAAADRYGLTLDKLGAQVNQLNIDKVATQLSTDWNLLTQDGEDVNAVMLAMKDKVQDVVTAAFKFGDTIPDSMKPMIESMIKAGLLTDDLGNKLTDDTKITFAAPIISDTDRLITKMDELIDKLVNGVGGALTGIGNTKVPEIKIPYKFEPDGDFPNPPIPMAEGGDFLVTKPTLFLAGEAGAERAKFSGGGNTSFGSESSNGSKTLQPVTVQVSGKDFLKLMIDVSYREGAA